MSPQHNHVYQSPSQAAHLCMSQPIMPFPAVLFGPQKAKIAQKTKNVAVLFFNVNNYYYFCTRKIVENLN